MRKGVVIIDTCSLMNDAFDTFYKNYKEEIAGFGDICIYQSVYNELKKHTVCGNDIQRKKAKHALNSLKNINYLMIKNQNISFADNVIYSDLALIKSKMNVLLITNDRKLLRDALKLNDHKKAGGYLSCMSVGSNGKCIDCY